MDLEANKAIAKGLFEAINAKDYDRCASLLADDLSWHIIGNAKVSGDKDKRIIMLGFKFIHRSFENFRFIVHEITAEADRVSVTAESVGKHKNGKAYNNHYHFLMYVREGRIFGVREYFDTAHAIWLES